MGWLQGAWRVHGAAAGAWRAHGAAAGRAEDPAPANCPARPPCGGFGTQKFVYQKWPGKIFPTANFIVSHDGHFGLGGRGGGRSWGGGGIPPTVQAKITKGKYYPKNITQKN